MTPYRIPATPAPIARPWYAWALYAMPWTWRWRWARRALGGHWEESPACFCGAGCFGAEWRRVGRCTAGVTDSVRCEDW